MADTYPRNTIDDEGLKKVWNMVIDRLGLKVDKEAGKGLSTNDYTATEKNKLAGIESGAEVNTVTSVAGKTGAVTLDKSDVGLSNVGNFKAVSTSANQGLTDTEKSNARANVDTPSNGDIQSSKTLKSSVVTVNDAAPINAEDITVDITPQQDLHGYDKPWAGGAGKNKLPMTVAGIKAANTSGTWNGNVYTLNGVTFEILTDSDGNVTGIKAKGTVTADVSLYIINGGDAPVFAANNYKISGVTNGSPSTYNMLYASPQWGWQVFSTGEVIPSMDVSRVRINLFNGYTTPSDGITFYPMIRLATETDSTFAPYSNICPIEGWTGAELDRDGANRYPILIGDDAFNNNASGTHSRGANGELIVTCASSNNASGAYANANSSFREVLKALAPCYVSFDIKGSTNATVEVGKVGNSVAVTTQTQRVSIPYNAGDYTFVAYGKSNAITLTISNMMVSLSQPTAYEPYQGEQYTASFGETVYGGKWHVTEGGTDKTMAEVMLSSLSFSRLFVPSVNKTYFYASLSDGAKTRGNKGLDGGLCSCFELVSTYWQNLNNGQITVGSSFISANVCAVVVREDSITTVEDFMTAVSGQKLVYELETPTTISTPKQNVPMLKGINTVYADCGDTSLKYQPDNVVGELKGEIEDNIIYEDYKWTTESSQSYSAGTPGTYGTSSSRNVKKEGYDVIGVTFVGNRRFGDCILTLYYVPSTSLVNVIIFRATSSAVTIADEDIEYRVAYKKRT